MSRIVSQPAVPAIPPLDDVKHVVLDDVTWELYGKLLRRIGGRPIRITYDNGRLEMMSPLPQHEEVKGLIHDLVRTLTLDLDMPMTCLGSTTFRREDKGRGLEPDDCYYFKHEAKMRGRKRLNPKKDPPPELVVEIDVTSRSIDREPIYADFGVPEIWRYNGRKLECLELSGGTYRARQNSVVFPFLAVADLSRFIKMLPTHDQNSIIRAFRQWVRENGWGK